MRCAAVPDWQTAPSRAALHERPLQSDRFRFREQSRMSKGVLGLAGLAVLGAALAPMPTPAQAENLGHANRWMAKRFERRVLPEVGYAGKQNRAGQSNQAQSERRGEPTPALLDSQRPRPSPGAGAGRRVPAAK